jgi:carbonic anhydrase
LPAVVRARTHDPDPRVQLRRAVEENVLEGIANLMTFPSIATAVAAGRVRLHGWVYGLQSARLWVYDAAHDGFVDVGEVGI